MNATTCQCRPKARQVTTYLTILGIWRFENVTKKERRLLGHDGTGECITLVSPKVMSFSPAYGEVRSRSHHNVSINTYRRKRALRSHRRDRALCSWGTSCRVFRMQRARRQETNIAQPYSLRWSFQLKTEREPTYATVSKISSIPYGTP